MYRCGICNQVSEPGQPRRVHAVYREVPRLYYTENGPRTRLEIEREIPVCKNHSQALKNGAKLEDLMNEPKIYVPSKE